MQRCTRSLIAAIIITKTEKKLLVNTLLKDKVLLILVESIKWFFFLKCRFEAIAASNQHEAQNEGDPTVTSSIATSPTQLGKDVCVCHWNVLFWSSGAFLSRVAFCHQSLLQVFICLLSLPLGNTEAGLFTLSSLSSLQHLRLQSDNSQLFD